ncbi:MAG: DUF3301 domain-containing protein [Magnetococcales bacterium]|nr:DUF3301 domain-containing protein [Magnetococcales bacterium]
MDLMATGILVLIGWIWYASMKAREQCHETAREVCRNMGVELLDDTVSLSHMGIQRNERGRLVLRRVYEFRYLDGDWSLHHGAIVLCGYTLESCMLAVPKTCQ